MILLHPVALEIHKYVIFAPSTNGNPRTLRVPGTLATQHMLATQEGA
jgi:hypothetical protein